MRFNLNIIDSNYTFYLIQVPWISFKAVNHLCHQFQIFQVLPLDLATKGYGSMIDHRKATPFPRSAESFGSLPLRAGPLITASDNEHERADSTWQSCEDWSASPGAQAGWVWSSCKDGHAFGLRGMLSPKFSGSVSIHVLFPNNSGLLNTSRKVTWLFRFVRFLNQVNS